MAENSKIEWTDHTFNPWMGCTKVAPGCENCYAEELMDSRYGKVAWGPQGTRVKTSDANWRQPLKWNREAEAAGVRARVFCASLADVFEEWEGAILDSDGNQLSMSATGVIRPYSAADYGPSSRRLTMNDLRRNLFGLIDKTPWLDWLLLTKRPENVRRIWPGVFSPDDLGGDIGTCSLYRPNVWLGTSVSEHKTGDENIPKLLELRDLVPVLFLSAEPLLGPIDLRIKTACGANAIGCMCSPPRSCSVHPKIDWVIVGGESGHNARPCDVEWIRSIIRQCNDAGVACFVKQLGAKPTHCAGIVDLVESGRLMATRQEVGQDVDGMTPLRLRDRKGGSQSEWPEDLRVREFPDAREAVGA